MRITLRTGQVDLDRREVVRGEHRVELRAKEAELLRYLATHAGRTLSREELFEQVWGYHAGTRSRTLDTTVRRLRAAIEEDPAEPVHLLTEVGVGYRFVGVDPPDASRQALEAGAARIRALLARRSATRVVLHGPHGVGKRTWALEAAAAFPGRVVQAGGPDVLVTVALALGLDPGGDPLRLRRRVEAARAGEVLLVLDDVPLEEVVRWAPPVVARRVAPPPPDPRYEPVAVEPLARDAARALLLRRAPGQAGQAGQAGVDGEDHDDREHLERLLDLLGGIPLAIELAAAQLAFCSPTALADALVAEPERLYDGATEAVTRAASLARAALDEPDRSALDAVSAFSGSVPTAVMAAAAGGVARLARLRDRGCLIQKADGGWAVPISLRVGADPAGRSRAADGLLEALSPGCDPTFGPLTFDARAALAALAPTLRGFADDPRLAALRVWSLVALGARAEAAEVAGGLAATAPLLWATLAPLPPEDKLEVVQAAPQSVARDALLMRLLRQAGRMDEAAAVPEPKESDGPAVGEWWHQRHHLEATRSDLDRALAAAKRAARAWRRFEVPLERARCATASLALLAGHLTRAERDYLTIARSPEPSTAVDGDLGLGFVALVGGDPAGARRAAERGAAWIPRLNDPLAVTVWNQVGQLWREVGEPDRVADAVAAGLELLAIAGEPAALEGGLHTTLGAALLDAGRLEEALVELRVAREVLHRLGLAERARYADLLARVARELRGEEVAAEWRADDRGGGGRVDHLVAALAGRPTPEALQFADGSGDPALRGVVLAMTGAPVAPGIRACSYEARVAERLHRARATDVTPVHTSRGTAASR